MYALFFKRIFDILISSLIFILIMPVLVLISILISIDSVGPILFVQKRVGINFNEFFLFKFRTMTNQKRKVSEKPLVGKALGVTRVGYYLRRLKLDELPQLINVIKGDMSLVGPRPSIFEQLENMNENEKLRYSVRPGMTGLAQVSGNIHIPWKRRFEYDLEYISKISLVNDVRILLRTFVLLFAGEERFKNKPLRLL